MSTKMDTNGVQTMDYETANTLIKTELEKATNKFPLWPTDPIHAMAVLGEEFGELTKDVLQLTYEPGKTTKENLRIEAIQTAAMAIRFLMSIDTYMFEEQDQHEQNFN